MSLIEPDGPDGPEIMPPETPGPELDPSGAPDEMPQPAPDEGGPGGDRPYDRP
jgi:hypothetical protein